MNIHLFIHINKYSSVKCGVSVHEAVLAPSLHSLSIYHDRFYEMLCIWLACYFSHLNSIYIFVYIVTFFFSSSSFRSGEICDFAIIKNVWMFVCVFFRLIETRSKVNDREREREQKVAKLLKAKAKRKSKIEVRHL